MTADGAHGYHHYDPAEDGRPLGTFPQIRRYTIAFALTFAAAALVLLTVGSTGNHMHTFNLGCTLAIIAALAGIGWLCTHLFQLVARMLLIRIADVEAGERHIADTLRAVADDGDDDGDELGRRRSG